MIDAFVAEAHYYSVDNLLHQLSHRFHRLIALIGYEEVRAEANLAYAQAYSTWTKTRGRLTTWTYRHVMNRLCKLDRDLSRRAIKHPTVQFSQVFSESTGERGSYAKRLPDNRSRFDLGQFIQYLPTEAARYAVQTALEAPEELTPDGLMGMLTDMGWAGEQILKAFQEVREALY